MITVIVPILNEAENIPSLLGEISNAAKNIPISEIIYIDDGSTDDSFDTLQSLKSQYPALRVIKHKQRSGQSAGLWTGIKAASNDLIVTLDGDGQNDPRTYRFCMRCIKNTNIKLFISWWLVNAVNVMTFG